MLKSLIVKTLLLPAVAGGAYLAGSHGELPTALAGDAPAAPAAAPATPAQAAGQVAVSIEVTDDGKAVARQVPQGAVKAPQAPATASHAAPDTRVVVVAAPAPQDAAEAPAAAPQVATPASSEAPSATPSASATPTAVPPFANCSAVRAAGKAPIHPGDPGWSDKLDRNHDGKAC